MAVGGSINSITLDGRNFGIAADADASRDLGGFIKELESNGNGTQREILTAKPWMVEGLEVSVDDANGDQEFLQGLADVPGLIPITVVYADLGIYQGLGTVTADLKSSSQSAKCPIVMTGQGKFTRQT